MNINGYTDWLEIDLGAFKNNKKRMQQITGKPVMAVIKANGYGHGLVEIARSALQGGVGVIAAGYADGFRRVEGNQVPIRGKYAPVIGSVCMDQCMVNLDEIPEARLNDEVVLIGTQDDRQISAEDMANSRGTIAHEVICGLPARLPRIYRNA